MRLPVRLRQSGFFRVIFAAGLAFVALPTFFSVSAQSASATGSASATIRNSASISGPTVLEAGSTESVDTLDGSFVDFFMDSGPITVFGTPSQAYSVSLPQGQSVATNQANVVVGNFTSNGGAVSALNQAGIGLFGIGGEIGVTGLSTAAGGEDSDAAPNRPILTVSPYVNVVINYN